MLPEPGDRMRKKGYLALARQYQEHIFYKEKRVYSKHEAWIDLLFEAQWQEEPKEIILKMTILTQRYGEVYRSMVGWGRRWQWSDSKVKRFFKLLKKMEQIDYQPVGVTTRISILNYGRFDPRRRANDELSTSDRRGTDEAPTTTKEGEEGKERKEVINDVSIETSFVAGKADDDPPPPKIPLCPHQKIIALYHKILPELNIIRVWDNTAKGWLKTRWREDPDRQCLEWWEGFFTEAIKTSRFLMGNKNGFRADMRWMIRPQNFAKIMNGNYVNRGPDTGSKLTDDNIRTGQKWAADKMKGATNAR